jgi:hypothetical protein
MALCEREKKDTFTLGELVCPMEPQRCSKLLELLAPGQKPRHHVTLVETLESEVVQTRHHQFLGAHWLGREPVSRGLENADPRASCSDMSRDIRRAFGRLAPILRRNKVGLQSRSQVAAALGRLGMELER